MKIKDIIAVCKNKESALKFVRKKQWPRDVYCLKCKSRNISFYKNVYIKKYRCNKCGYIFSDISNTPFKGCRLPLNLLFQVIWHLEFGFSIRKTAKSLGINTKTVIKIKKKKTAIMNFLEN